MSTKLAFLVKFLKHYIHYLWPDEGFYLQVLGEDRENDLDKGLSACTRQPFTLIHWENRPTWLSVAAGDPASSAPLDSAPTRLRSLTAENIRKHHALRLY
jgi:hypothetical protein